jgi:hypothetical protein
VFTRKQYRSRRITDTQIGPQNASDRIIMGKWRTHKTYCECNGSRRETISRKESSRFPSIR